MSKAWSNPKEVKYDGVHLTVHGVDIREELRACMTAYDGPDPNYALIGKELGKASRILVQGGKKVGDGKTVSFKQ